MSFFYPAHCPSLAHATVFEEEGTSFRPFALPLLVYPRLSAIPESPFGTVSKWGYKFPYIYIYNVHKVSNPLSEVEDSVSRGRNGILGRKANKTLVVR